MRKRYQTAKDRVIGNEDPRMMVPKKNIGNHLKALAIDAPSQFGRLRGPAH